MAITLPLSCKGVVQEVCRLILFVQEARQMPVQILVVDDDSLSREVLALLLCGAGYAVETADSGDAALLHLQTAPLLPQVVLADLQMPGTTGSELALRLRSLCGPRTMLLAMSATPPSVTAPDDGADHEFDGFLLKPFTMETFTAAIAGKTAGAVKEPNGAGATVLDEVVYTKLAGSLRRSQLEQLYTLCLADAERRIATMRQAASGNEDAAYKRAAHAIKGGCGMVGALELQRLATSMEERGLSDDHVASLKEFIVACQRLRGMLIAREIIHDQASGVSGEDA
jgi:CheY-like chemotaxis protein/HPt (histidine-containing phosphotransfer) domain-containing protein